MKTLLTSYRIRNLDRSLDFYAKVGFREIGRVPFPDGSTLVMLNLPGDEDVITIELAFDPRVDPLEIGNGFSHIALQVDDLARFLQELTAHGIAVDGPHLPGGEEGPQTAFVHDPDGYRFELVQWPATPPTWFAPTSQGDGRRGTATGQRRRSHPESGRWLGVQRAQSRTGQPSLNPGL